MNQRIKSVVLLIAGLALTVVPALIYGQFVRPWGDSPQLRSAGNDLNRFPNSFGAWDCVSDGEPLPRRTLEDLGVVGYLHRNYRHRETGALIGLLLMVGRPGPIVRHPPQICYTSIGNQPVGEAERVQIASRRENHFKILRFRPAGPLRNEPFTVAFSHTARAGWKTPRFPRLLFGGQPLLYKMQALTLHTGRNSQDQRRDLGDLLSSFARAFEDYRAGHPAAQRDGLAEETETEETAYSLVNGRRRYCS